jgi:YidC/Oxa1 family membrane protein insertase
MGALWDGLLRLLAGVLSLFYDIIPNLGISIILLTILVNVLVFPLTLKQTRSTRAMQTIQPEVEKLRKEYKDEPEALNQEVMKLYKERGVNPAGCFLPLLVQMPVWFALFRVLREPLEYVAEDSALHDALLAGNPPTFLGMDLARPPSEVLSADGFVTALPYLALVGVVVATGLVQQRLTTASSQTDPNAKPNPQAEQMQRIGKIMPLFFGVISYVWPAGLNLYFATSNLFRTGQMWLINRIDGPPGAPASASEKEPEPEPESTDESPKQSKPQGSAKKRNRRRRK